MPAEWERHDATWIAWPHNRSDWPGKFAPVPWVYAEIVRHLSRAERVNILVDDAQAERRAAACLRRQGAVMESVRFWRIPTDRVWARDFGPIFTVRDGADPVLGVNWRFSAWAKYPDWKRDDAAADGIVRAARLPQHRPVRDDGRTRIVLEGGSIDVNGEGLLLTTEECLLSDVQQRNPGMDRAAYERAFADNLGAGRTIWLRNGIAGDDTHGHVDDLARFTDPGTVVVASEPDRSDPNHEPLKENLGLLKAARGPGGERLRVVTLPMPEPVWFDGQRLPASYANFYIANGVVLVPVFNDPNDRVALDTLQRLFPSRRVIGVCCTDLVLGLGTLHCMTQQQPAPPRR
jgi:agmatine deiminase